MNHLLFQLLYRPPENKNSKIIGSVIVQDSQNVQANEKQPYTLFP